MRSLVEEGSYAAAGDKYITEFAKNVEGQFSSRISSQLNSVSVLIVSIACYSAAGDDRRADLLSGMALGAIESMESECDDKITSSLLREWSADVIFFTHSPDCIQIYQSLLTAYDDLGFNADLGYSNEQHVTDEQYAYSIYIGSTGRNTQDPRRHGPLSDRIAWKYEVATEEFHAD